MRQFSVHVFGTQADNRFRKRARKKCYVFYGNHYAYLFEIIQNSTFCIEKREGKEGRDRERMGGREKLGEREREKGREDKGVGEREGERGGRTRESI